MVTGLERCRTLRYSCLMDLSACCDVRVLSMYKSDSSGSGWNEIMLYVVTSCETCRITLPLDSQFEAPLPRRPNLGSKLQPLECSRRHETVTLTAFLTLVPLRDARRSFRRTACIQDARSCT